MRVADRPLPPVIIHAPENPWPASWPIRPVVAIQQRTEAPYTWDDARSTWNDPTPLVWDASDVFPNWIDASCDLIGLDLEVGNPDDKGLFAAGHLVMTLNNSHGDWSLYRIDGTQAAVGPGSSISVWAQTKDGTQKFWLAVLRVARWDELPDDIIEVEAFDSFSDLAQPIGTYTPGVVGDHPAQRLNAIMTTAQAPLIPTRFATGLVTLTQQSTEQSPLEEMQTVTASDGGVLYTDADGTVTSYDRQWRTGRSDQPAVPIISDNVCTAPIIIWTPVLSNTDAALAVSVVLQNVAKLRSTAQITGSLYGRYVYAENDQQWTLQAEGDQLAAFILSKQQTARLRLDSFDLYVLDPGQPTLWRAVDWRLFDLLRFIHDSRTTAGLARVDVLTLITSITHAITANNWIMTVATSKVVGYVAQILWDTPLYLWDSSDPAAVWGY